VVPPGGGGGAAAGWGAARPPHDEVLCKAIETHGGWLFKHTGDGVCRVRVAPSTIPGSRFLCVIGHANCSVLVVRS
jgi:hypothetical protein